MEVALSLLREGIQNSERRGTACHKILQGSAVNASFDDGVIKLQCPVCGNEMALKKKEPYKQLYICAIEECLVISVIVTTTQK